MFGLEPIQAWAHVDLTGVDIAGLEDVIVDPTRVQVAWHQHWWSGKVKAKVLHLFMWTDPIEFEFEYSEFLKRVRS